MNYILVNMIQKKTKINIKIQFVVNKNGGNVTVYNIGINKNKNEDIVYKRLFNRVLFNNNNINFLNYHC